ncbi:GNAT family N-acetyltransferase [Streptomyces sp. WMMC500]|uniref:GNAT family N-acetyltransferase n=1 Tax=Streptomyces sp. WMMC500 TaxID=3015154 RepID=UPI00248D29B9|nr:GNAT family N-acetyltransferase [Streptomyces sp. WMMC500]WBB62963.1 GNAT family N-acetyltransferase [Streptomyces sp. WMMC500]
MTDTELTDAVGEPVRTARLDLLPLHVAHADEMAGVLADPALYAFTGGSPPALGELRARYARLAAGAPGGGTVWGNWVLRIRADGTLCGYVQVTIRDRVAEVAWVVGTPWQGQGFAGEAARGLVARLRGLPLHAVVAHVHPDHRASAAVAASAGLARTDLVHDGEAVWRLDLTAPTAG